MEGRKAMSTETKEIRKAAKLPSIKSEAELGSEREKLLAQIDDFDKELEGIAEKHAQELAADSPNGQRLDELEEIRDRFNSERERLVGRVKALEERSIPAARREATRVTMEARRKEFDRQRALIVQSHAAVRGAIETLRKVKAEIPWEHPHPEFLLLQLTEELGFDASELGEKPPALEPAPNIFNELGELIGLAREIAGRVEYQHAGYGPLTMRGKVAATRRRNEAAASMGMTLPHPNLAQ
jgi:hypothetical protein